MFDPWRRPGQDMPQPVGRVATIRFDDIDDILATEGILATNSILDQRLQAFLHGLRIARDLVISRAQNRYDGYLHVALTALYFKVINDLLASCLSIRCGYTLQSFPCLRAAFEAAEIMEYLLLNPGQVNDYIRGRGEFERNLEWMRRELPDTPARSKAYGFFNYFTHNNSKGLSAFMRHEQDDIAVLHAGAQEPPHDALRPYIFATTLLAYATRSLWQADTTAVQQNWVDRFDAFDKFTNRAFAPATDPPSDENESDVPIGHS